MVHFEPMSCAWDAKQGKRIALPPCDAPLAQYIATLPDRADGLLDLQQLFKDRLDEKAFMHVVAGFDPVSDASFKKGIELFHNLCAASMRPPDGDLVKWYAEALQSKSGHFALTEAIVCHVLDVSERQFIYHWDITSDLARRITMKKKVVAHLDRTGRFL